MNKRFGQKALGQQQSQAKSPKTAASDGGKAEIENDRAALLIGSIGAATRLTARRAQLQISCHSVGDLELALGGQLSGVPELVAFAFAALAGGAELVVNGGS